MTETLNGSAEGEVWQNQHQVVPVPSERVRREVLHYAALCLPDQVHWCGGASQERQVLHYQAVAESERAAAAEILESGASATPRHGPKLDRLPGGDAGKSLRHLFRDSMNGRTMYVVPFVLPADGTHPEAVVIQLTDSAELASEIEGAFLCGDRVWARLAAGVPFWLCLHASGNGTEDDRVRWELPAELTLWAFGRDYGIHTLRRVLRGESSL